MRGKSNAMQCHATKEGGSGAEGRWWYGGFGGGEEGDCGVSEGSRGICIGFGGFFDSRDG